MKLCKLYMPLLGASLVFGLAACEGDPNDRLIGASLDPGSLASEGNTQHHFTDPNQGDNGITDPNQVKADDQQVGSAEVVARLHACSKMPYSSLGNVLGGHGVDLTNKTAGSAAMLYKGGAASLGVANYTGRVPEMIIGSTAALSKQFDIMVAASIEIQTKKAPMTNCPGTAIVDGNGQFTQDGLSCLMGKPATATHVSVANDAVNAAVMQGMTQAQGQQIAIAALLEAAHTCE